MVERMFGTGYVKDERIKVAIDEAGNYSFIFMLIVLWGFLVWSLLAKKTDAMLPVLIIFLLASGFYLVSLIRRGALTYKSEGKNKPNDSDKKFLAFGCGAAAYFLLSFFFKWCSDPAAFKEHLFANIIAALIMTVIWVPLFGGLMKLIFWLSSRITEKKVSPE